MRKLEDMYGDEYDSYSTREIADMLETRPGLPNQQEAVDTMNALATAGESAYGMTKGAAQGEAGILNFAETVFNGLKNVVTNPDNKSLIDSFTQGYQQGTITPNSKEFKAILDKFIPSASKESEAVGELFAPGVSIGLPAKAIAKGVQATTKAVTKKAK